MLCINIVLKQLLKIFFYESILSGDILLHFIKLKPPYLHSQPFDTEFIKGINLGNRKSKDDRIFKIDCILLRVYPDKAIPSRPAKPSIVLININLGDRKEQHIATDRICSSQTLNQL